MCNSYTWDRANRLLSMGGASYSYDGAGNRISQTIGVDVTQYLLDLQPGLATVLQSTQGSDTTRYLHAPRGIHGQQDTASYGSLDNWTWMLQDGLGSVRSVVDSSLSPLESRLYEPYGTPFGTSGTSQTVYGFTGEQTDANGQVYLRARYYNPSIGVFTVLDPFEGQPCSPMSLNGYSWVEGNVPNAVDPSGKITDFNFAMKVNSGLCGKPKVLPGNIRRKPVGQEEASCQYCSGQEWFFCQIGLTQPCSPPSAIPPTGIPVTIPPINTQLPSGTPIPPTATPDAFTDCQQKLMAVAVANEVGNGGYDMALIVSNIIINRLRDGKYGTPTMETLIQRNQISAGLLDRFEGSCPDLGNNVYN